MLRTLRPALAGIVSCVLAVGAVGCGGESSAQPPISSGPSVAPTVSASAVPTFEISPDFGAALSPASGVPTDFPTAEVPLPPGPVTQPLGPGSSGEEGRKGWVLAVEVAQDRQACYRDATAALTANGFTLAAGPDRSDSLIEAQYISEDYVVIVSARDGENGGCSLGYEVAQVHQ